MPNGIDPTLSRVDFSGIGQAPLLQAQAEKIGRQTRVREMLGQALTGGGGLPEVANVLISEGSPEQQVQGIALLQNQQKQVRAQVEQETKNLINIGQKLFQEGVTDPKVFGIVATGLRNSSPRVAAVFDALEGQDIAIGNQKFQITTEQVPGVGEVAVKFNPRTGAISPVQSAFGPGVALKPPKISQRFVNILVDKTGRRLTPKEIQALPESEKLVGSFKQDATTGALVFQGFTEKITPQQKAAIQVDTAKQTQLAKEDVKDIEETEDVVEKIQGIGKLFTRHKAILDKVPGGFIGGAGLTSAALISKFGLENEFAKLRGGLKAVGGQFSNVARTVGSEKGVLTEQDITRAAGLLPNEFTSESEREGQYQESQNALNEAIRRNGIKNNIQNFGRNFINFTGNLGEFDYNETASGARRTAKVGEAPGTSPIPFQRSPEVFDTQAEFNQAVQAGKITPGDYQVAGELIRITE